MHPSENRVLVFCEMTAQKHLKNTNSHQRPQFHCVSCDASIPAAKGQSTTNPAENSIDVGCLGLLREWRKPANGVRPCHATGPSRCQETPFYLPSLSVRYWLQPVVLLFVRTPKHYWRGRRVVSLVAGQVQFGARLSGVCLFSFVPRLSITGIGTVGCRILPHQIHSISIGGSTARPLPDIASVLLDSIQCPAHFL